MSVIAMMPSYSELQAENDRLRAEIERLRQERDERIPFDCEKELQRLRAAITNLTERAATVPASPSPKAAGT